MKRLLAISVCVLFSVVLCYSEWYWSSSESIDSENGRYLAQIIERPSGTNKVEVSEKSSHRTLWARDIDWPKACLGLLSNDGKVFAVVNNDYSDKQYLVTIYTENGQAGYSVKDIKIDLEDLIPKDNKYQWIDLDGDSIRFSYDTQGTACYLDLRVFSGKTLEISLH